MLELHFPFVWNRLALYRSLQINSEEARKKQKMNDDQFKKIDKLFDEYSGLLRKDNIRNIDELSGFLRGLQTLLPDSDSNPSGSSTSNSKKIKCPYCGNDVTVTLSK